MKMKLACVAVLSIALLVAFQLTTNSPAVAAYAGEVKRLEVCGEAVFYADADVAVIHVGVQKKDKSVVAAQAEAVLATNKLIEMLKSEGVDGGDIQTANYSIYPDYSYEKSVSTLTGYNVSSSLTVKIRDIKNVGRILQRAVEEGSNTSGGVYYEMSDDAEYYQKALSLAVLNAENKARIIAENLGFVDYKIVSITEKQVGFAGIKRMGSGNFASDFATAEMNVMPGKIAISACVEVAFSF